eukprot:3711699-Amphidinium_carterae.1
MSIAGDLLPFSFLTRFTPSFRGLARKSTPQMNLHVALAVRRIVSLTSLQVHRIVNLTSLQAFPQLSLSPLVTIVIMLACFSHCLNE